MLRSAGFADSEPSSRCCLGAGQRDCASASAQAPSRSRSPSSASTAEPYCPQLARARPRRTTGATAPARPTATRTAAGPGSTRTALCAFLTSGHGRRTWPEQPTRLSPVRIVFRLLSASFVPNLCPPTCRPNIHIQTPPARHATSAGDLIAEELRRMRPSLPTTTPPPSAALSGFGGQLNSLLLAGEVRSSHPDMLQNRQRRSTPPTKRRSFDSPVVQAQLRAVLGKEGSTLAASSARPATARVRRRRAAAPTPRR
jgi:hypothetical protein